MLDGWMVRDGATVEEQRSALVHIVDRVVSDPDTGTGKVLYRIGVTNAKFNLTADDPERGFSNSGIWMASPRGAAPRNAAASRDDRSSSETSFETGNELRQDPG